MVASTEAMMQQWWSVAEGANKRMNEREGMFAIACSVACVLIMLLAQTNVAHYECSIGVCDACDAEEH